MTNGPLDCCLKWSPQLPLWANAPVSSWMSGTMTGGGEGRDDTYALVRENDGKAKSRQG